MEGIDSEFPLPTCREEEAVRRYFSEERSFMASENFYNSTRASQIRKYAVQLVSRYWQGSSDDAFVPYLAMNYFDRFVSRHALPTDGGNEKETIQMLVVCCITIASKMRRKSFSVDSFLTDRQLDMPFRDIMKWELTILNALEWRMRPITPICYLDHYYPLFAQLGRFSRRHINEMIVQSQGELSFTRFKPSEIALSSFVAAATIQYPKEVRSVTDKLTLPGCASGMIALGQTKVKIPSPDNPRAEQSKESEATSSRRMGKAPESEIVPADKDIPKKQMNFPIQWVTDMYEEVDIPAHDSDSLSQGSASTSTVNSDINTAGFTFCGCHCNCNFLEGLSGCCNIQ